MEKKRKIKSSNDENEDAFSFEINANNLKQYVPWLILFLILIFGFYLRLYHVQYPVIGYHNWKDTHYLTEARNFAEKGFFKYGFFVPMQDTMESIKEDSEGAHGDTFPMISIVVGFFFKIFGESLLVARLVNIAFSLIAVVFFYLLVRILFEREDFAILSAFLAALNPLYVFFSHNTQLDNPALAFMLAGGYFFVRWVKYDLNNKDLIFTAIFTTLGVLTKYTFIVIVIPMLFCLPLKKILINWKKHLVPLILCLIVALAVPAWYFYGEHIKNTIYGKGLSEEQLSSLNFFSVIDLSIIFQKDFWQIMESYISDNFTIIGFAFSLIGMVLFLLFISKNINKMGYRFMLGYLVVLPFFLVIMGYKLSGHSYHQFPVAPAIIFFIAYFLIVIATNLMAVIKVKHLAARIIIILLLVFALPLPGSSLYSKSFESRDRMFNTQFPGLDIAGDYIREHSSPDERVLHSSGQSFGVLWHAARKGYKPQGDVKDFIRAEQEYNVNWVFVYQWGMQKYFQEQNTSEYLKSNYRLVQFGFIPQNDQQIQPLFFLFRKGGNFSDSQFNTMVQEALSKNLLFTKPYEYTTGTYEVKFINFE